MKEAPQTREELRGFENVAILERPEARYRLIYENHELPHSLEEIGKPDALVIEFMQRGGMMREEKNARITAEGGYWLHKRKKIDPERRKLFDASIEYLEKNKIPVYFIDISEPKNELGSKILAGSMLRGLEVALSGTPLIYAAIKRQRQLRNKLEAKPGQENKPKISRRNFLKYLSAGAIAAYGGTHILDDALFSISPKGSSGHPAPSSASRAMRQVQETIHPETDALILTLRNAVWAEKLQVLGADLKNSLNRQPEIAMQLGAMHTGLENMLAKTSEERLKVINDILRRFGIKEELDLASTVKAEYSEEGNRWAAKVTRNQKLEKLEKDLWPETSQ